MHSLHFEFFFFHDPPTCLDSSLFLIENPIFLHRDQYVHKLSFYLSLSDSKMGLIASTFMWENLLDRLTGHKEFRMVMVGLDAAGKTTILYKLKLGEGK